MGEIAKGDRTRSRILDEAVELASVGGLGTLTIGPLAERLGLSKSGLFAHFGSKQALQEASVAYGQDLSAAHARNHGSTKKGRRSYSEQYLSVRHRDNPGGGCTMACLAEVAVVAIRDERRDHLPLSARQRIGAAQEDLGELAHGLRRLGPERESARDSGKTFWKWNMWHRAADLGSVGDAAQ